MLAGGRPHENGSFDRSTSDRQISDPFVLAVRLNGRMGPGALGTDPEFVPRSNGEAMPLAGSIVVVAGTNESQQVKQVRPTAESG